MFHLHSILFTIENCSFLKEIDFVINKDVMLQLLIHFISFCISKYPTWETVLKYRYSNCVLNKNVLINFHRNNFIKSFTLLALSFTYASP